MAVDTRNKRSSSFGVLRPVFVAYPLPDGSLGEFDRKHVTFAYAGISSQAGTYAAACSVVMASATCNADNTTIVIVQPGYRPGAITGESSYRPSFDSESLGYRPSSEHATGEYRPSKADV